MFLVAIVISGLTQRARNQAAAAQERERRTAALYALSRELLDAKELREVIDAAARQIETVFGALVAVYVPGPEGRLVRAYASLGVGEASERDASISQWVWSHRQEAGLGTSTLPGGSALFVPLVSSGSAVGVVSVTPEQSGRFERLEQRRQLDAFAAQMAVAMERARLAEATEKARLEVETEQLRSSLLSSVSHDLRTPLAVITGAASTLLENGKALDAATRQELTKTVLEEAERLSRLIRNLLDMTRLEAAAVRVKKEWVPLEEVVGSALSRLEQPLAEHDVHVSLEPELPLLPLDAVLIEQVLINLLENALKYGKGPFDISGTSRLDEVVVEVSDRGPGIPAGQEARVFDKFHRAVREGGQGGVGLGLAICRAIVAAHGGRIWAKNRPGGGAVFSFALPIAADAPKLQAEPTAREPLETRP
jgi:two-component system sensor histidine kinase KdpD